MARENFLDKLKREREEAAAANNANRNEPSKEIPSFPEPLRAQLPTLTAAATAVASSSEEESSDEEVPAVRAVAKPLVRQQIKQAKLDLPEMVELDDSGNLMLRKRSMAYVENGKIKISSINNGQVLHRIERKPATTKKDAKHFDDDRAKEADKKRLESLGKMKDSYNQQKMAIKNALSKVDATLNKKIIFDAPTTPAAESVSEAAPKKLVRTTKEKVPVKKATGLFDEDDDDEDGAADGGAEDYSKDFQVKEHYEGADGARLLKLQSRFKNDQRFKMDAKFLEQRDGGGGGDEIDESWQKPAEAGGDDDDDERQWQYNILESVMGKKIQHDQEQSADKRMKYNNEFI